LLEYFTMSRFNHRGCDSIPLNSILAQLRRFNVFCAVVLGFILNTPAPARSASATIQVRARSVTSCRVSANSLHSAVNITQGRFNCPTSSHSSTSSSGAPLSESASYNLSDVPGTGGAVKILTINF